MVDLSLGAGSGGAPTLLKAAIPVLLCCTDIRRVLKRANAASTSVDSGIALLPIVCSRSGIGDGNVISVDIFRLPRSDPSLLTEPLRLKDGDVWLLAGSESRSLNWEIESLHICHPVSKAIYQSNRVLAKAGGTAI